MTKDYVSLQIENVKIKAALESNKSKLKKIKEGLVGFKNIYPDIFQSYFKKLIEVANEE